MSHFSVLVSLTEATKESLESALQPFHEYECTGIKDKYVVFEKENKEELIKEFAEDDDYDDFNLYVTEYHGYEFNSDGDIGRWTNPNGKWDWWVIGGRWSEMLIKNNGDSCDHAYKKDIDFETMKSKSVENKIPNYEKAQTLFNGDLFLTWKEVFDKKSLSIDEKRKMYHEQPAVKRFKEEFDNPFIKADDFYMNRDDFIKKSEFEGISTFAILHNGKWIEKGDMGWFGCVGDEKENWVDVFNATLNEIPEDNYLIVVDCHI